MANPDWEDIDPDALMRSARQHDWMAEPRFKRMFEEIEDKLQGVLGSGQYDWVDRRVFDAVFDRSTLLSLHKLMQAGEIETGIIQSLAVRRLTFSRDHKQGQQRENIPYYKCRLQKSCKIHRWRSTIRWTEASPP